MTFLVASSPPIDGAFTVKRYAGFGIRGADIPTTGDSGGSPIANDSIAADSEYCWEVVTPPASGTLTIDPDLTFSHVGAADGTWPWVAKLFEDGYDQGNQTIYDTFGEVIHEVTIANSQQANQASSASINQTHLISVADSQQVNTASSASVSQQVINFVSAGNSQQVNQASPASVSSSPSSPIGSLSDEDIGRICDALMVRLLASAIPVNIKQVNSIQIKGVGTRNDPWNPI